MGIRAVIYDLDGTITQPFLDFDTIRKEMGLALGRLDILDAMDSMSPQGRQKAEQILHEHESQAVQQARLNDGVAETLQEIRNRGLHVGLLTRNTKSNAISIARRHNLTFDAIIDRHDGPPKPDPHGILALCRQFGVQPKETLVVGDFLHDLLCAKAAGAISVLLTTHKRAEEFEPHADYVIAHNREIIRIIDTLNNGTKGSSS